jgi:hypothetical protein
MPHRRKYPDLKHIAQDIGEEIDLDTLTIEFKRNRVKQLALARLSALERDADLYVG